MLGRIAEWMLPTPSTFYFNAVAMLPPPGPVDLPDTDWTRRESHALLDRSEDRRRTIETKGPGLATVSAILVAGILVALSNGWEGSIWPARLLLVGASFYGLVSLLVPIYLVGPLRRQTIRSVELTEAADQDGPEAFLALKARAGAAINDHHNLALTNLQHAARKEAWFVWALLVGWVLLVPLTGIGKQSETPGRDAPATCLVAKPHDFYNSEVEKRGRWCLDPRWPENVGVNVGARDQTFADRRPIRFNEFLGGEQTAHGGHRP